MTKILTNVDIRFIIPRLNEYLLKEYWNPKETRLKRR